MKHGSFLFFPDLILFFWSLWGEGTLSHPKNGVEKTKEFFFFEGSFSHSVQSRE